VTQSNYHLSNQIYSCEGTYSFIGNGVGKGKQITYADAWKGMIIDMWLKFYPRI